MSEGRWRISVTAPDWGEDHLTLDAIVAFVDEELDPGPQARATRHVARCQECAAQVVAQTQARVALRTAAGPRLPSSLLSSLRSIPQHADLPAAPAGLAMTEDGQIVCRAEPAQARRSDLRARFRSAPSAPPEVTAGDTSAPVPPDAGPAGLPPVQDGSEPTEHGRRTPGHRRIRLGTGVAMSGLALGALAFGATAASPFTPASSVERGVLGGPVLSGSTSNPSAVVDARLRMGGGSTQLGRTESVLGGLRELPGRFGPVRGLW